MTGEDTGVAARPTVLRRIVRTLLWMFVVLFVLAFVLGGGAFLVEFPLLLFFGWAKFLLDVAPSVEIAPARIVEVVLVAAALVAGTHAFGRWMAGAAEPPRPWRLRWTVLGLSIVMTLFVAGIGTIGLSHQVAWLFLQDEPWIDTDDVYLVKARVQEGINLSNPARTALGIACAEGDLAGADHESLELLTPAEYAGSYTRSVTARGVDAQTGVVTIVLEAIGRKIPAGATIVYTGRCSADGMRWTASGTIPKKYLPRT